MQKVTAASPRRGYAAELFDLVNKDPERWAVAGNVVDLAQQPAAVAIPAKGEAHLGQLQPKSDGREGNT